MVSQREQTAPSGLRKSRPFRVGSALGWALLLAYALWVLHNTLPLLSRDPRLSAPDLLAQALALPSPLSAPGVAPALGALMVFLFIILLALTVIPMSAQPTPAPLTAPDPPAPTKLSERLEVAEFGSAERAEGSAADAAPVDDAAVTPQDNLPTEAALADAVLEEVVPADAALVDAVPVDAVPVDVVPVDVVPVDAAPVDVAPVDVAPVASDTPDVPAAQPAAPRVRQVVNSRRVFISSTSRDLLAHRKRVHDDLERMYQAPVDMAQFGAGGADAITVSYTELATADIVVLIVAWRYGFIPDGQTRSVTELEYDEARRLNLPIYVYLADPATEADDGPDALFPAATRQPEYAAQLAAFRARLSDSNATVYDTFTSPADLSARVATALARRLLRTPVSSRLPTVEARALDRRSFNMGDDDAATSTYLTAPVQAAWDAATQAIAQASAGVGGKRGVVVLGEANAGKTRLALEALMRTLPEWSVLSWRAGSPPDALQDVGLLPNERLALFVDDLQQFASLAQPGADGRAAALVASPAAVTLQALVGAITAQPFVIVATCRSEDEQAAHEALRWLFDKLTPVRFPQFSENRQDPEALRILAEFAAQGATHLEDWDGTLGSLVLGLSAKRAQYEGLARGGHPAADALRAMKLLTSAGVYRQSERRVRAVCAQVLHHPVFTAEDRVWDNAYTELLRLQFVRIAENTSDDTDGALTLVIRKDAYFDSDKVMADYPNPFDPGQSDRHLAALQPVFEALADFDGLFSLGVVFYERSDYDRALAAYARALALRPDHADTWHNLGVALGQLGRGDEALAAYERALALRPDHARAWNGMGYAYTALQRYDEAVASIDRALALEPEHANWWDSRGEILLAAGRPVEALAAYERALALQPDLASSQEGRAQARRALGRDADEADASDGGHPSR